MNNIELIDTLDDQDLLSLVELLSRALMMPSESIRYLADDGELIYELPVEAVNYCEDLSASCRLKLMQLAINTLVAEAEKPAVPTLQLALQIETGLSSKVTCPTQLLKPNYGHSRNQQQRH